jgi:hypothetical protein
MVLGLQITFSPDDHCASEGIMYLDVCCFAPLSFFSSILFLLPPIRRAFQRVGNWRFILLAFWSAAWFMLSLFMQLYDAANAVYTYSAGEYSHLTPSTIATVKQNRNAILVEFGLRTLLWHGYVGQSCFTQQEACRLADEMDRNLGAEIWWGGSTEWMLISGLVTAMMAVVGAAGMLLVTRSPALRILRDGNSIPLDHHN